MKQGRKGINWVKNLLQYSKCLNNDKREELGWRSAFEVYYGRKSNELVKCRVPVKREKEFNEEEEFIRYGKKSGKKVPKQRFVIHGEVIKVGKNEDMYKIKSSSPVSQLSKSK